MAEVYAEVSETLVVYLYHREMMIALIIVPCAKGNY